MLWAGSRAWVGVLVVGALLSAAYALCSGPLGADVPGALVYLALGVLGTAGTAAGAVRHPPRAAAAWWCVAAMQLLWLLADAWYLLLTVQGRYSGAAAALDVTYLPGYVPLFVAVVVMLHRTRSSRPPGALVDAAVLGVGLLLLGWALLVGPVVSGYPDDPRARFGATCFLAADVVLTVLLVVLLVSTSRATTSTWLGLAGALAGLLGDCTYALGDLAPQGLVLLLSLAWTAGSTLWAAAALHPSAGDDPPPPGDVGFSAARLATMVVGVSLPPGLLALDLVVGSGRPSWPAVLAAAATSVLVVCRLGLSLRATAASLAERERMRRALEHETRHDGLTGLLSRMATVAHLSDELARARARGTAVGVLFVDLDGFKAVNDAHGHRAGDEVLRVIADRLRTCVGPDDAVGRLGGDEFVVVVALTGPGTGPGTGPDRGADPHDRLLQVAHRVVEVVSPPVRAFGATVQVGASVGAALAGAGSPGGPALSVEQLLHEADSAVYRAKALGRGRVEVAAAAAAPAARSEVTPPAPR